MHADKLVADQDFLNLPVKLKDQVLIKYMTFINEKDFETCFKLHQSLKTAIYFIKKADGDFSAILESFLNGEYYLFSKKIQEYMKNLSPKDMQEIFTIMLDNPVPVEKNND